MTNLMLILLCIFAGIALMVLLGERFAKPANPEQLQRIQRWIMPLVGVSIVLALLNHYL